MRTWTRQAVRSDGVASRSCQLPLTRSGVWTLNMVAVCDADAIKTILRTKADNFQKDDWTYDTFRWVKC